jgi:hypothetical protein
MANFPLLNSGSAAQYPFRRSIKRNVMRISFVDGTEQRSATSGELHEWTLPLVLLQEQELSNLLAFFEQQEGEAGTYSFTDPATGIQYPNCSFAISNVDVTVSAPGQASTLLIIRENPA